MAYEEIGNIINRKRTVYNKDNLANQFINNKELVNSQYSENLQEINEIREWQQKNDFFKSANEEARKEVYIMWKNNFKSTYEFYNNAQVKGDTSHVN